MIRASRRGCLAGVLFKSECGAGFSFPNSDLVKSDP